VSLSEKTRQRLLLAALTCIERWGLAKTSLEDVARQAGLSRATVYRYFPVGREELVRETIAWEVGRFFARIEEEVGAEPDLAAKLRRGLMFGHRAIDDHALLQRVLATEPEPFLAELARTVPTIETLIRTYLLALLRSERLRPGIDASEAADYLTRLFLSYLGTQGRADLTDPVSVDRLVTTQFLGGIVGP
jgi:AcrR family transcriptional regulator